MVQVIPALVNGAISFLGWAGAAYGVDKVNTYIANETQRNKDKAKAEQDLKSRQYELAKKNGQTVGLPVPYDGGSSSISARNTALGAIGAAGIGYGVSALADYLGDKKSNNPIDPKSDKPTGDIPAGSDALISALNQIAENGHNIYYALDGEQGLNDRLVEIQNVLVDVRESIDILTGGILGSAALISQQLENSLGQESVLINILDQFSSHFSASNTFLSNMATNVDGVRGQLGNIASKNTVVNVAPSQSAVNVNVPAPEVIVNNSIDFEPVKSSLEAIKDNMPDKEKADLLAQSQKEALDYQATANNLTLVEGEPVVRISPRDAAYLSNAQNMKHKSDINNEQFDEDDFNFENMFLPSLPFEGVSSAVSAFTGSFLGGEGSPSLPDVFNSLSLSQKVSDLSVEHESYFT